jgi:nitrate/TMAO reductase-like tetraheme cytochrome c subunit
MSVYATLVAVVAAFILYFAAPRLVGSTAGKLALLFGIVFLPSVAVATGAAYAFQASSTTAFCNSCHEMTPYGKSLFVDDRAVVPAVHYQRRLVDRDHACFECHTNYAMFGSVQAKLDGLRHVWVHYLGEIPETFELYEPYPNRNCLHCHDDARGFLEAVPHAGKFEALLADEQSCLECHHAGHGHDRVARGEYWQGGL